MRVLKFVVAALVALPLLNSCGSVPGVLSTPVENIDSVPLKITDLSEDDLKKWGHLDLVKDTIPGISLEKAYTEIIKNRKGTTTIVAVIDSGIDIDHEDLVGNIWKNPKEIPNNGKDDDKNGFIDDVYGWNFLGDTYDEQFEYVRLLASGDTSNPRYADALAEYQQKTQEYVQLKTQYQEILKQLQEADKVLSTYLKKSNYTKEEVYAIKTDNNSVLKAVSVAKFIYSNNFSTMKEGIEALESSISSFTESLEVHLNKSLKGRKTKDDPNDITDVNYGNNNVKPLRDDESHGTFVAGIIAGKRNNGIGINGVANNVKIMSIRNTPNGDEYDKDVALGIRYAVDNGAKVVNMSFGKYYSPHTEWVKEAILYAAKHDVLLIHAAGNEGLNIDTTNNYPTDVYNGKEIANNFISVGALTPEYGSGLIAGYSNYGQQNVDIFAPGSQIYSLEPNNTYNTAQGTSFAAPMVAGVAALIRSFYPKLSAAQVKQVILDSGLAVATKVVLGNNSSNIKPFKDVSKSGKILNAYNALIMASRL